MGVLGYARMNTYDPSACPLSDEQIIERILAGDTASFELLMRRHNQTLFRIARSITGNDSEAEDVVQEAYVNAYGALANFQHRSKFKTWITRIVLNEALRRRRKHKPSTLTNPQAVESRAPNLVSISVDQTMQRSEINKALIAAFDSMSVDQRTVLMLRLIEGLSTKETAQSLDISESNVKVSLHRAKKQLAENLEDNTIQALKEEFSFATDRCDRIVKNTYKALAITPNGE